MQLVMLVAPALVQKKQTKLEKYCLVQAPFYKYLLFSHMFYFRICFIFVCNVFSSVFYSKDGVCCNVCECDISV